MRTVSLAKIAAQAEILRLRRLSRRSAFRLAYAAVASTFMLAMMAAIHVAIVMALMERVQPIAAVLIVAGGDLVIAIVLGVMAARDSPDSIEAEAQQVKETALLQLRDAAAMTALVGPALRMVGTRKVYGIALAALTARYLGGRR